MIILLTEKIGRDFKELYSLFSIKNLVWFRINEFIFVSSKYFLSLAKEEEPRYNTTCSGRLAQRK
jgi:hypothetical protein